MSKPNFRKEDSSSHNDCIRVSLDLKDKNITLDSSFWGEETQWFTQKFMMATIRP